MTLSMLCRAARPTVLSQTPASAAAVFTLCMRQAHSLSAIHAGIRRSSKNESSMTYAERKAAREALPKPTFKIRKGKKDITDYPAKADPQTRRARFYDPESKFGKKSLVYKLKTGQLDEDVKDALVRETGKAPWKEHEAKSAGKKSDSKSASKFNKDLLDPADFHAAFTGGSSSEPAKSEKPQRRAPAPSRDFGREPRRGSFRERRSEPRREGFSRQPREFGREPRREGFSREPREFRGDGNGFRKPREERTVEINEELRDSIDEPYLEPTESRRDSFRVSRSERREQRPERRDSFRDTRNSIRERRETDRTPRRELFRDNDREETTPKSLSIPYTTAASQFLYGTSVVEAALQAARRKLYKLYIYAGANRERLAKDAAIQKLAQRNKVETVFVNEEGIKMMDKMSGSRPHNGYILEASPLPQPPVISLGEVVDAESGQGTTGYKVVLGHQSHEEALINGKSDFVSASSTTHKPLVVVVDQILDPGNLGAILRSVSFLGATAVAITKRESASLTPVALKASAGASESLTLFSVDHLPKFLQDSRENGWLVYAAVPRTSGSGNLQKHLDLHEIEEIDPLSKNPCILLLGSEGEGLPGQIKSKADYEVNIPNMSGGTVIDSLNVSVAAGLLTSAFMKGQVKSEFEQFKVQEEKSHLW
ncbi:RNA methyltransferase [Copromyces sp. CBS 386.78]|nr:RNA methyltransferase [Copromyces sp. CBS 386.78]